MIGQMYDGKANQKCTAVLYYFVIAIILIFTFHHLLPTAHADKVYIDITSPKISKLPIAIQDFVGASEISNIVRDDLTFTGLFDCIDAGAHIEKPDQPFNPNNWRGLGAELVVKGRVAAGSGLTVIVSAYDISEGREILRKEYSGSPTLLRTLAHSISNDIYRILTGRKGIFRTKIAFIGKRKGSSELFIMDWDGHRINKTGVTAGVLLSPRWSPDGSKLIYSAERNRSWDIYLLDMNTMVEKNIVSIKGLSIAGNFFPEGKEFVFASSKEGRSDIYIGDIVNIKGRRLISSPWIDVSPSVSPDGKHILFVSNRSGSPQVYITDREGQDIRRLTFSGSYNTSPVWSPNMDKIAFVSMINGKNQIFIIKPDGTEAYQLTERGNNEEPSFSPDGRYLAFTSDRDGTKGIYLMRADGEGQVRITPKGISASNPAWSP